MNRSPRRRALIAGATMLAFCVAVFGSYVRLKDAGLGCPDWPGCYGQLIGVPDAETAGGAFPDSPLDKGKAWIEVAHRYLAGILGLLIVALAVRDRLDPAATPAMRRMSAVLLALVVAQALLGMLTVTRQLMPAIVVLHLLGGVLLVSLLAVSMFDSHTTRSSPNLRRAAAAAVVVLAVQVALGGLVSTNLAGLACGGFPTCNGQWVPPLNWEGLNPSRELGRDIEGGAIGNDALASIHWLHRLWAVPVIVAVSALALAVAPVLRRAAAVLAALLAAQLAIGVGNVVWSLPLALAVAHNAGAAALAAAVAATTATVFRRRGAP